MHTTSSYLKPISTTFTLFVEASARRTADLTPVRGLCAVYSVADTAGVTGAWFILTSRNSGGAVRHILPKYKI